MEYLGAWGTMIHEKNLKLKISCQTPFKCILNDTNLNNSFKIHHFKKKKKNFHHCTLGDLNRLPQQLVPQQHKFSHKYAKSFYWLEGAARMFCMKI